MATVSGFTLGTRRENIYHDLCLGHRGENSVLPFPVSSGERKAIIEAHTASLLVDSLTSM
jgi:hypothetical protein